MSTTGLRSLLVLVALAGCGPGAGDDLDARLLAVTDGKPDPSHPSVGYIEQDDGSLGCTATLVGRGSVLTAGHCIWPDHTQVVVLEGARYRSAGSAIHPAYDPESHAEDIGVILWSGWRTSSRP